jgi:hypothetical protein
MERLPSKIPKLISNILLSSAPAHTDNTAEPLDRADLSARMEKRAVWNSSPTPLKSRSRYFDSRHHVIPSVANSTTKLYTPKVTQRSQAIKSAMKTRSRSSSGISILPPRGARPASLIPQPEQSEAGTTGCSQILSQKIPSELHSEVPGIGLKTPQLQDSTEFSRPNPESLMLNPMNHPSANPTHSNPPPPATKFGRDKSRNSPPNSVNHPRSKKAQPQNGNNLNIADSNSSMLTGPNCGLRGLISGSGLSPALHQQQAVIEGGASRAATDDVKRAHSVNQSRQTRLQATGSIDESNPRDADLTGDAAAVSGLLGPMTGAFSTENTISHTTPISYLLVADGAGELHGTGPSSTDLPQDQDSMYHRKLQQIGLAQELLDTIGGMCASSSIIWSELSSPTPNLSSARAC